MFPNNFHITNLITSDFTNDDILDLIVSLVQDDNNVTTYNKIFIGQKTQNPDGTKTLIKFNEKDTVTSDYGIVLLGLNVDDNTKYTRNTKGILIYNSDLQERHYLSFDAQGISIK